MQAREFLRGYLQTKRSVERLDAMLAELWAMASGTGMDTQNDRVQSSQTSDKVGDLVARIVQTETELTERRAELIKRMEAVERVLGELKDERHAMILNERYIKGQPWTEIEKRGFYSRGHMFRLHDEAVKEVQKIIDKTENETK